MKRIGVACIGAGKLGLELPHIELLHVARLPVIYHEELLERHSVGVMILTEGPPIEIVEMIMKRLPECNVKVIELGFDIKRHIPISDMLLNETFVMTISDLSMDDYKLKLTEKEYDDMLYTERKDRFKYAKRNVKINVGNHKKKAFFQRKVIN